MWNFDQADSQEIKSMFDNQSNSQKLVEEYFS